MNLLSLSKGMYFSIKTFEYVYLSQKLFRCDGCITWTIEGHDETKSSICVIVPRTKIHPKY